ncbi:MAG TPA: hypothetical protein PLV68_18670, partial [Ilumatobacteraceae bacterium]|nr:hypothetical protein [Ilumatobacteraceae bacterium]
ARGALASVGRTYFDAVLAGVAGGAAAAALGDDADALVWLTAAVDEALAVNDVVAVALAQGAYLQVTGEAHPSGAGEVDRLGAGWRSIIEALPQRHRVGHAS